MKSPTVGPKVRVVMVTQHFNALTEAQAERLAILVEECGEVVQAACKILRHGYDSTNNGQMSETNRQQLQRELGDLLHAVERMARCGDVQRLAIEDRRKSKPAKIRPFLHHQEER